MPGINLGLGLLDERSRSRVFWVQCGGLRLKSLVVAGDLGQRLGPAIPLYARDAFEERYDATRIMYKDLRRG